MIYSVDAGIQVSLDGTTWYQLTDHNRQPIAVTPTQIESSTRMANGKMRKYVIAIKRTFAITWDMLPSDTAYTVDGYYSSAWAEAFYNKNAFVPIYLKLVHSKDTDPSTIGAYPDDSTFLSARNTSTVYNVFMTKFDSNIVKRTVSRDFVTMNIEFTEI